jgi:hypothetical protein
MKKSYKIIVLVRHVIMIDAYNEEDAIEQAEQTPLNHWDDFKIFDYEITDINPLDDYDDAPRDDLP